MKFISHPLIKSETMEERDYQINVLNTAVNRNTLCVLPTGTGKTNVAILLAANRLEKYPDSKILILAPTRPLCAQHQKSFQDSLNIPEEDIILLTGKIPPHARGRFYKTAKIISATPQTIENDINNRTLDFSDFSLLVIDECHRSVNKYAYPVVANAYVNQSKNPRILGLTASPGSSKEKIDNIRESLFIESVEIRTETDRDVKPFIKELDINWIKVDLPDNFKEIQKDFRKLLNDRIEKLKKYNIHVIMKRDVLKAQKRVQKLLNVTKNPVHYYTISLLAEILKVWHALELLETQSIFSLHNYLERLKTRTDKSSKRLLVNLKDSVLEIEKLYKSDIEHPKINKLEKIISDELENNKNINIIIFSHFRDNIDLIKRILGNIKDCKPVMLIGQSGEKGMSQKEQIDIIKDYEAGFYNCLITSPIGEEGLHIPSADLAIFYEPVPSEIRTIQRRGRVGRTKIGKIIFLLTKKTRDEAYYWTSYRKEKRMKTILKDMQEEKSVLDFI